MVSYDFERRQNTSNGEIGQNIVLIGTAEKGPYMAPTLITSVAKAKEVFGSFNRGNLVRAFTQAFDTSRDIPIYMMRIGCTASELTIRDSEVDYLHLQSYDVTDDYNNYIRFSVEEIIRNDGETVIKKVLNLYTKDGYFMYEIEDQMTVNDLSRLINNDYRANIHQIKCSAITPNCMVSYLYEDYEDLAIPFTPGNDGTDITKDYTYLELELAYDILQGRNVDVVVPVDCYIDDIHPVFLYKDDSYYGGSVYSNGLDYLTLLDTANGNQPVTFHEQLINFCFKQTLLGYMSLGVIGFRPLVKVPDGVARDNSYLTRILDMTAFRKRTGFTTEVAGKVYDRGFYIQPVASELVFNFEGLEYFDSGVVRYAALVASTMQTTTNMMVGDDVRLRYDLSNYTRSDLSRLGIVTFRNSVRRGLVVQSGVTAAVESSPYHQLINVRMVQLTISAVNATIEELRTQEYKGEILRSVTERSIAETLSALKSVGIIESYGMHMDWLRDGSEGEIMLSLKGKHSIESIRIISRLGRDDT